MSTLVRDIVEGRHPFCEVASYYVVLPQPNGAAGPMRRIQAGFDVDVYWMMNGSRADMPADYSRLELAAKAIAASALSRVTDSCWIDVVPFNSTVFIDTRRDFQPLAMLRIRVSHGRGLEHPVGAPEASALKEVMEQLQDLGVRGRGRT